MHVANLHGLAENIAKTDEFAARTGSSAVPSSVEEIRAAFEKNVRSGEDALRNLSEQAAMENWKLVYQGKELFRKTRVAALRANLLNHLYHHRGQLSVYLRLLDVPVPVVYGPTADENPFV